MMRALVLLLLVLAVPAGADNAQAIERLTLGAGWAERGEIENARRQFRIARGLADDNVLKVEALARSAALRYRLSADRATDIGLLMNYVRTTPPRFLSDEARTIVAETHAAQAASGQYEFMPPGPGIRRTQFEEGRVGSGFTGARYHWILPLPVVPPPRVVDSDVPDRMQDIQAGDWDRLGDPARRIDLGNAHWALVDPRHDGRDQPAAVRDAWRFDRVVVGYTLEPIYTELDERGVAWWKPLPPWYQNQKSIWQLRFRLFYPSPRLGASRDYQPVAEEILDCLLRLHQLAREAFGREALEAGGRSQVINVWLTENSADGWDQAGAERSADGIYLYQAATERQPEEWLRQLAHEYSHAAWPPVARYAEASDWEPFLEGSLGERLLQYAFDGVLTDQSPDDLSPLLAFVRQRRTWEAYRQGHWDPFVESWLNAGPTAPQRRTFDNAGAAWTLGLGCWIAEAHEPGFTRELWRTIVGAAQLGGDSLMRTYIGRLQESREFAVSASRPARVVDDSKPPRRSPRGLELADGVAVEYRLYLPREPWQLRLLSAATGQVTVQIDDGPVILTDTGDRLTTARINRVDGGEKWHTIRLTGFGANATVLRQLHFKR